MSGVLGLQTSLLILYAKAFEVVCEVCMLPATPALSASFHVVQKPRRDNICDWPEILQAFFRIQVILSVEFCFSGTHLPVKDHLKIRSGLK